jgi:predicted lipid-binding transport protein (Tim44 family)
MRSRTWIAVIGLALGVVVASEVGDAWARAGSGGGGGSRGSRSYSSPARPAPASPTTPSSPSRSLSQPAAPVAPSRPSFFSGLMGGIAGFALGGLLGSLLFGGLGRGFGIGMMDILLIGGGLALLFMFLRRRRTEEPQPAYAGMGGGGYRAPEPERPYGSAMGATAVAEPTVSDVDRGLGHIRSMDGSFDPDALVNRAREVFFDVQAGITARDVNRLGDRVTSQMLAELQKQCEDLRAARRTNRVERIDLRRTEISEAWQESGRDYVTVYMTGALLDYTVDDATGAVVAGSATDRDNFEEFWTFTRPVGPNPWQLSAIQTA